MRKLLGTVAAVLFSASGSLAQDPSVAPGAQAGSTAGVHDWQGAYFGLHAGGSIAGDVSATISVNSGSITGDDRATGFLGGIQAGYNYQLDHLLFGIEGDFSLVNITASGAESGSLSGGATTARVGADIDWFATIRGRIGYVHDRILFYGTGGVAFNSLEGSLSYSSNELVPANASGRKFYYNVGWVIGAGIEGAIHDKWTLKTEYMYIDFMDQTDYSSNGIRVTGDFDQHVLRIGLNRKFSW